jgi:hypothetical protein
MRSLFWICAALVAVTGVMSTNLWRQLRTERDLSAALRTQVAEASSRELAAAQAPPPAAAVAVPAPAPLAAAPAKSAATSASVPVAASAVVHNFANEQRELWKDPEYRKARLAQIRTNIARNYPGLAEELGLSPAETDQLFDVLAQNELNITSNNSMFMASVNDPAALQDMSRTLQEQSRQGEEAIAATLGSARYAQWQQYQQNQMARSQASSLNTMLAQAGQPLSKDQLKSLTTALGAETQRQREETIALTRGLNLQDPAQMAQAREASRKAQEGANQRVLAAAASVVSAQQLELIRAQMEQQQTMTRAMMRMSERQNAAAQAPQQVAP